MGSIIQPVGGKLWTPTNAGSITNYIGRTDIGTLERDPTHPAICSLENGYTAITGDVLTELKVYTKPFSIARNLEMGLYTDNAGVPDVLIALTGFIVPYSTIWNWHGVTGLSVALTPGTKYLVAVGDADSNSYSYALKYDTHATINYIQWAGSGVIYDLRNPWIGTGKYKMRFSLYAKIER